MAEKIKSNILPRLSVLLFLQFFVWGAWYLSVSLYMMENGMGDVRFYAYTAGPLAAIITPVIMGMFADRFFNMERVLAFLFLMAGISMLALPWVGSLEGEATNFMTSGDAKIPSTVMIELFGRTLSKGQVFNGLILVHMLCYMPTLGLTAALSFKHLPKGNQQFPLVRLWGTLGWIAAGFLLAGLFFGQDVEGGTKAVQFYLGGGCAVLLGIYCLTLPKTPAPNKGEPVNFRDLFFLDAWKQFGKIDFSVFMACAFLLCIPLAAYYVSLQQQMAGMGMKNITVWKNIGTWVEAGLMFAMPFFFRKLGVKKMIAVGILAWIARYALFSFGATPTTTGITLVMIGIALHGFCYDFFFVTGQIYVDQATPQEVRGQAQGLNILFTQGLGMLIGAMATGALAKRAFGDMAPNGPEALEFWPKVWWPLCAMTAGILVIFLLGFHPKTDEETATDDAEDKLGDDIPVKPVDEPC